MTIPPLANGVLPPGTYPATLGEIGAAFDQPGSSTRPALNEALRHAATLIWSGDVTAILYINGSYVTDKLDPLDVDMAIRSDVWDDMLLAAALTATHPAEAALVDFYCNAQQSTQRMEDLFREIQGSGTKKGIIQLIP